VNSEFLDSAFTAASGLQVVMPLMQVGEYALEKSGAYRADDAGPLPPSVPNWLPQNESGRSPRTPTPGAPTVR
jgi:hypothetical protein